MVSVSTKLATFPSSSMPRELNLVPARRETCREIIVKADGKFVCTWGKREIDAGIVNVLANPRMTHVRIWHESRLFLSEGGRWLRKKSRELIMYEFHSISSSRVPISKAADFSALTECQLS